MPNLIPLSAFERLESRRLFAVDLTAGVLTITGTDAADEVHVATKSTTIAVVFNGVASFYNAADVQCVNAKLGAGNDYLDCLATDVKLWVDAEGGNDTLLAGGGSDCLIGGLDNDLIDGGLGDDSLSGNGGKDNLNGGPGRDRVDGGKSNDIVRGGSSNDRLIGGEGSDELYGDGGDDLFYSDGIYTDYLFGGTGSDRGYWDDGDVTASVETRLVL